MRSTKCFTLIVSYIGHAFFYTHSHLLRNVLHAHDRYRWRSHQWHDITFSESSICPNNIFEYYSDILITRKMLYRVIDVTDSYIICSHQISVVFSILYLNGWKFWKILWYRVSANVVKLRGHKNGRLTYIYIYTSGSRRASRASTR